jgi:predicted Zn-dependent protease
MFRAVALTDSDPAAAREIVQDGLGRHPESPGLRVALARVLLREGDEAGARAALADAIERQPDVVDYVRQDAALARLL